MTRSALYPGSFDPVTNGHVDLVSRAARLFDRLVLAIGVHHGKKSLFSLEEKTNHLDVIAAPISRETGCVIEIISFSGLVVEAMKSHETKVMVRGLRDTTDFEYEMQLAGMNAEMSPGSDTIFLPASPSVRHIASSLVKQISTMQGDISRFVPHCVLKDMQAKNSQ
ncbi:MAG: pantetheine-phosphate adenylyltransferase [Cohaesibacteraceae bacterium]|nr:pantetheine-phosphate adenylyltransferase [Cohaesibacteraceae bacterium]